MTQAQQRFVDLEKRKVEYKKFLDDLTEATHAVADEVGIDGYFQDDESTVYKMIIPQGRFVHFEKIGYLRTRRSGEKRGDLSLQEAQRAGFAVAE